MYGRIKRYLADTSIIEYMILLAFVVVLSSLLSSFNPDRQAEYSGWCKLTGNEKNLTYEEYKAIYDSDGLFRIRINTQVRIGDSSEVELR